VAVADYVAEVLSDSPEAYWQLNDGSGTPADSSGNGWTLTTTGSSTYLSDPLMGTCIDGSVGDWSSSLRIPQAAYTLEAWVAPVAGSQADSAILADWFSTGAMLYLPSGFGRGYHRTGFTATPLVARFRWQHFVLTWNGTTVTYYMNGVSLGTQSTSTAPGLPTGNVKINNYQARADSKRTNSPLAHAAVYDFALSSTQVTDHYNAMFSGTSPTENTPYTTEVIGDSPTAYFPLDSTDLTYRDLSGSGFFALGGAATAAPTPADTGGPNASFGAISLDGADYANLGTLGSWGSGLSDGSFTVEMWLKADDTNGAYLMGATNNGGTFFFLRLNTDSIGNNNANGSNVHTFNIRDSLNQSWCWYITNATVCDGNWHHVVWSAANFYGSTSGTDLSVYVDGSLQTATRSVSGLSNTVTDFVYPLFLGMGPAVGTITTPYFRGDLAHVAFYPDALTSGEVAAHYAAMFASPDVPEGGAVVGDLTELTAGGSRPSTGGATVGLLDEITAGGARNAAGSATVGALDELTAAGARPSQGAATVGDLTEIATTGARQSAGRSTLLERATILAGGSSPAGGGGAVIHLYDRIAAAGLRASRGEATLLDRVIVHATGRIPAPPTLSGPTWTTDIATFGTADIPTTGSANFTDNATVDAHQETP
jgi:hypothetical protein